ncbi:GbsR/MarR family transcriptional regulator [Phytoactinopolyspora endophytica]|uniref:GbsR/MarR family transcriptional regulator n=1 Tax=Phytoactinopolyspora endophytica TaxID=1642495 RepID=UPI00197C24DD|nr:helix-turn-helix domain-containing protein [Phytoactinopolyspora endophytica]
MSTRPLGRPTSAHDSEDAHEEAVLRFVEQFALLLSEAGLGRMPSRVFAYVLADDAETYTARQLADGLRVSPAAISGAVRTLVHAGLLARERAPGTRIDQYRVYDDDIWASIMRQRIPFMKRCVAILSDGVELVGADRAGGHRIRETLEFYRFWESEVEDFLGRWQQHRERWLKEASAETTPPDHREAQ